jgi:hypothetical protein
MFTLQQESGDGLNGSIQVISFIKPLPILVVTFLLIKYIQLILLSRLYKFRRMHVLPYPRFWNQILSLFLLYFAFFYAFSRNDYVYALFGVYGLTAGIWIYIFYKEGYISKIFNNINDWKKCLIFIRTVINIFLGGYFLFVIFLSLLFSRNQLLDIYTSEVREIYYYFCLIIYCIFNIIVDLLFIGFLFPSGRDYKQLLTFKKFNKQKKIIRARMICIF